MATVSPAFRPCAAVVLITTGVVLLALATTNPAGPEERKYTVVCAGNQEQLTPRNMARIFMTRSVPCEIDAVEAYGVDFVDWRGCGRSIVAKGAHHLQNRRGQVGRDAIASGRTEGLLRTV